MCGIVGYAGYKDASAVIVEGLKKLEYRGYDSAGLALQDGEELFVTKAAGSVATLEQVLEDKHSALSKTNTTGIGHTRWATHGKPTDENAHPHSSCSGEIALVHNGIIENFKELRLQLENRGHTFKSDTDTEVLAHLIEESYSGDLHSAVCRALKEVKGSYALVVLSAREQGKMVCARQDSPLVIGIGINETLVASDIPALLNHTRKAMILEDGDTAIVTAEKVSIFNADRKEIARDKLDIEWDLSAAEKEGYDHFMLKEIMEQPRAVRETIRQRIEDNPARVNLDELEMPREMVTSIKRVHMVACGTAYHAGLFGKLIFEKLAGIPVDVEVASEYRYRDPYVSSEDLCIVISQSGETADTLAALRLARGKGARVLAITNVVGSSVSREADHVLYTWAGPEIAVASTKAYITQLIAIYLLALYLGEIRGPLKTDQIKVMVDELKSIPSKIEKILEDDKIGQIKKYCSHLSRWDDAFFIGRNLDYPVAMEGALKLKEISYIHAEAYPAGELKHGPLALITEGMPVIAIATQEAVFDKTLSNIQEIGARGGTVFAIIQSKFEEFTTGIESFISLPETVEIYAPLLAAIPTQLIAYYTAIERGSTVDKPRNLAKSVTVE